MENRLSVLLELHLHSHLASIDCTKTIAIRGEKHYIFGYDAYYIRGFTVVRLRVEEKGIYQTFLPWKYNCDFDLWLLVFMSLCSILAFGAMIISLMFLAWQLYHLCVHNSSSYQAAEIKLGWNMGPDRPTDPLVIALGPCKVNWILL